MSYLTGDFECLEQESELVLKEAKTVLDKTRIYEIQIAVQTLQSNVLKAIDFGKIALLNLGVEIPQEANEAEIGKALQTLNRQLENTQVSTLADLPITTDATTQAAMHIMGILFSPIIQGMPGFLPVLSSKMVGLSLQAGNTVSSTIGYALHGLVMSAFLADAATGYAFGKVALSLLERFNHQKIQAIVLFLFGNFIQPHKEHLRDTIKTLKTAYQAGVDTGDFLYAGFSLATHSNSRFFSGEELGIFAGDMSDFSLALDRMKQYSAQAYINLGHKIAKNLIKPVSQPHCLIGDIYDENVMRPKHQIANDRTAMAELFIYKLLLASIFGNYADAISYADEARQYLDSVSGSIFVPIFYFYAALAQWKGLSAESDLEKTEVIAVMETDQFHLMRFALHAPMNHQHKVDLIEAEKHRISGDNYQAADYYDRAIAGAKANGYIQEEALANELAAQFYLDWGKEKVAAGYLQEAHYGYGRWGATAKLQDLEQRYPKLLAPILQQPQATRSAPETGLPPDRPALLTFDPPFSSSGNSNASATLDLATVLKASQTLSSAIEIDKLLATLLHTVLENAGADKGVLLMHQDNQWFVEAVATIDQPAQIQSIALANSSEVPQSLINTVKRSWEAVVIVDASAHPTLAMDAYVAQQQSKSLLCTPILNQGKLVAILYLENHVTVGAFTSDRVELLNFLCSQAAISLENARLYQQSQSYAQQLERSLQKLTESESQLQALAKNIPGVIFKVIVNLKDASDSTLYASSGCYELYGVTAESFMAGECFFRDFDHPDDRPKMNQAIEKCLKNLTPLREELRIITKTDETKWIQIVAQPQILPGGFIVLDGVLLDISDRKRLESEQQRLLDVLEATPDYIGIASADGKILWHNKHLRELRQDLVDHKNISECHPAWVNEIILNQVFPILMEQGSWSGELALLDSHGKEIPVSQVIIAHKSKSGEIQYISTIMRDISDRKAYEERLEKNNAELIRATRMKDEFLATMSHELRTPMNAILGMTEILQEEIFGEINEKQMKALATVEHSGNHLLELINDILDVSKIESGQIELDYQNTAIIPLCQQSLDFIKPQAAKKSIQTKITLPVDLPSLNLDERRIRQVLVNLLGNAVKFTPEGGCITLEVIYPITIKQRSYVKINVKDTGIGIAPENLQKVFEPFIQVDSALNRKHEGTGLGLALVKRIVELHQGEVTLTSELGVGSCFAMALPLQLFQSGDDHKL